MYVVSCIHVSLSCACVCVFARVRFTQNDDVSLRHYAPISVDEGREKERKTKKIGELGSYFAPTNCTRITRRNQEV